MKNMARFGLLLVAVALLVAMEAAPAAAVQIQVDGLSDGLWVLDSNGNIFAFVTNTEADELANGPGFIYSIFDPFLPDPNQQGFATVLTDADGDSDIFGVAVVPQGQFLSYSSDLEGIPIPYGGDPNFTYLPEGPGGFFDATRYLNPALQAQGFTAVFFSDGNVPEPSTLVLAALGLIGLGVYGWRRKR